jgi:oxygen-independent coproporphyrinogen III oxidase
MGSPLSLYFHIPFCKKKCPYCHFYSVADNEALKDRYEIALCTEIDKSSEKIQGRQIVSIYFGGGTPFLFGPERTSVILKKLSGFQLDPSCEITIETNPETTTIEDLQGHASIGINRLSIGAQSFTEEHLTTLQRNHSPENTLQVIKDGLTCGFSNISIDLMYDLPHLSLDSWQKTLEHACSLSIQHLSLYNLTIEPKTPWFRKKAEIESAMPSDEISLQMYQAAQEITKTHGFYQYELSAFAKPGFSSRHNIGYWNGRDFLGFGPSAFSFFQGIRSSNIANLSKYLESQENNGSAVDYVEQSRADKRLREMVAIGLRMNSGICLRDLEQQWGTADEELVDTLHRLETLNLIKTKGSVLSLTEQGRYVYDSIAVEII